MTERDEEKNERQEAELLSDVQFTDEEKEVLTFLAKTQSTRDG